MSERDVKSDRTTSRRPVTARPAAPRRPSAARAASMLGNRAFTNLVARTPTRTLARQEDVLDPLGTFNWAVESITPIQLSGSVGRGGDNDPADVMAVRDRLWLLGFQSGESIDELAQAIESYQRSALHFKHPDGRVDPGGQTIGGLNAYKVADQPSPTPNPTPTPTPTPTPAGGLAPGDHVWEWNGNVSEAKDIPQKDWFGTTAANDFGGHGKEIHEYVIYPDHVKRGQPHMMSGKGSFAWLNNNPGNLTGGGTSVGEYPGKRNWHGFLIFPTPEDGLAAIPKFLKANGYGPLSIAAAFKKYAPKGDGKNDPAHYAQSVADAIGVSVDTKIDDLTDDQLVEIAKAIKKMEGTVPGDELSRTDPSIPEAIRNRL
jgi:hypothetical protein